MRLLTVSLFLALALFAPLTQDESVAIIAPVGGQSVSGLVLISGSADSPQFQRYELDFGYEPNPTDTWFPIQDPVLTPQAGGLLGQWNTLGQGIADGVYALRLRLYRADGSVVEAFVHAIAVQNGSPAAPSPATGTTPAAAVATDTPTATGVFVELPPSSTPRPTQKPGGVPAAAPSGGEAAVPGPTFNRATFSRAFVTGIGWAFGVFAVLGLYTFLRPLVRPRLRQWIRRLLIPR